MKTIRGLLVLDFSIQAVLIGGMLSSALISGIFFNSELIEILWIPYFILGGWQLFFALGMRYLLHYRGMDNYIKLVGVFALFATGFIGLTYLGGMIFRPFFGFFIIAVLWMTFVPPMLAIGRFAGAYRALETEFETYGNAVVS